VCACQVDIIANLVDHRGELLVQIGSLVDLEKEFQSAFMSTIQWNQLWLGIFWIIQNTWIFGRSANNEKCFKLDFLPPQIFLDFYSPSTYFYWAKNRNPCLLNQKREISVGPACQPHGHLPLLASIAVRSSPGAHLHRALLLLAALPPCISLASR
jgi:hypothetical protein